MSDGKPREAQRAYVTCYKCSQWVGQTPSLVFLVGTKYTLAGLKCFQQWFKQCLTASLGENFTEKEIKTCSGLGGRKSGSVTDLVVCLGASNFTSLTVSCLAYKMGFVWGEGCLAERNVCSDWQMLMAVGKTSRNQRHIIWSLLYKAHLLHFRARSARVGLTKIVVLNGGECFPDPWLKASFTF